MTGRDYHLVLVCTVGGGHDRRELAVLVPVRSRDDLAAMADPDVYAPSPDGQYAAALARGRGVAGSWPGTPDFRRPVGYGRRPCPANLFPQRVQEPQQWSRQSPA